MIRANISSWVYKLFSALITGASSAGLASLGITVANIAGIKIPPLDIKQLGSVCLGGGIVGLLSYLAKSPLPTDDETKNTETK